MPSPCYSETFLLFFRLGGSSVGLGASYRGAFAPKNRLVQGQTPHYKPRKAGDSDRYQLAWPISAVFDLGLTILTMKLNRN